MSKNLLILCGNRFSIHLKTFNTSRGNSQGQINRPLRKRQEIIPIWTNFDGKPSSKNDVQMMFDLHDETQLCLSTGLFPRLSIHLYSFTCYLCFLCITKHMILMHIHNSKNCQIICKQMYRPGFWLNYMKWSKIETWQCYFH